MHKFRQCPPNAPTVCNHYTRIVAYISEVIIGKVLWWPFVLLIDLVQINQINSNGHCVTEEVDLRRDTTEPWRGIEVFVTLPLQANKQCLVELYI